jgi:hypothetical protein
VWLISPAYSSAEHHWIGADRVELLLAATWSQGFTVVELWYAKDEPTQSRLVMVVVMTSRLVSHPIPHHTSYPHMRRPLQPRLLNKWQMFAALLVAWTGGFLGVVQALGAYAEKW